MKLTEEHVAALADIAAQRLTWVERPPTHELLDLRAEGLLASQPPSRGKAPEQGQGHGVAPRVEPEAGADGRQDHRGGDRRARGGEAGGGAPNRLGDCGAQ